MPSPNEITVNQPSRLIGTPNAPILIDVRPDDYIDDDPFLIPGATRHPFNDIAAIAPKLVGQSAVLYCKKGKKLGHGTSAILREMGVRAEVLEGGQEAWRAAGHPLLPIAALPPRSDGRTVWVTRQRPKIDRIACPWLIRRFVDPNAQFLFVPPSDVLDVAENFNATPFDVEGVFWSHRGENCTFDTMIDEFGLNTDPLRHVARIVRAADTDELGLEPQAAGLLAFSVGLSRMFRDDLAQLDAGMTLYDALYRWARDGRDEAHDWSAQGGGK